MANDETVYAYVDATQAWFLSSLSEGEHEREYDTTTTLTPGVFNSINGNWSNPDIEENENKTVISCTRTYSLPLQSYTHSVLKVEVTLKRTNGNVINDLRTLLVFDFDPLGWCFEILDDNDNVILSFCGTDFDRGLPENYTALDFSAYTIQHLRSLVENWQWGRIL